jgi:hypothetical protein
MVESLPPLLRLKRKTQSSTGLDSGSQSTNTMRILINTFSSNGSVGIRIGRMPQKQRQWIVVLVGFTISVGKQKLLSPPVLLVAKKGIQKWMN